MEVLAAVGLGASCLVLVGAALLETSGVGRVPAIERALSGLMLCVVSPTVVFLLWQGQFRLLFVLLVVGWGATAPFLPSSSSKAWWTCLCVSIAVMGWWLFGAGD